MPASPMSCLSPLKRRRRWFGRSISPSCRQYGLCICCPTWTGPSTSIVMRGLCGNVLTVVCSIGNAKISGMEEDLNLTSNQYSIALVVFFVGYVVFEVPSKYDHPLQTVKTYTNNIPAVSSSSAPGLQFSFLAS